MRKKINKADKYYIEKHCETMSPKEISTEIDLNIDAIDAYFQVAKQVAKNTKRKNNNGATVLTQEESQMADDVSKMATQSKENTNYIWRS